MLKKILVLIEDHNNAIKEAKELIEEVKSTLEASGGECCFNIPPGYERKMTKDGEREVSEKKDEMKRKASENEAGSAWGATEEAVYEAIKERVKKAVKSKGHIAENSGAVTDLIKLLSDKFISTTKNPSKKSDADILQFVKSHKSEITKFMESECSKSISSCLAQRIKEETTKNLVLHISTTNVTPPVKSKDTIEPELSQKINIEQRGNSECNEVVVNFVPNVKSAVNKGMNSTNSDQKDTFPLFIKDLNSEQETLYTEVLTNNLDGVTKVISTLPTDSQEITQIISALKSSIKKEKEIEDNSIIERLKNLPQINPDFAKDNRTDGELITALDNALFGLEMDIRDNLFKKTNDSIKHKNLHQNPKYTMFQKIGIN